MSKYAARPTHASDPGGVELSVEKYKRFATPSRGLHRLICKLLPAIDSAALKELNGHLMLGDSRAAVVMRVDPLLTAAYTDELDCVAMLWWPDWLVSEMDLTEGHRLLTVNTYVREKRIAPDLIPGEYDTGNWQNFFPLIADFLSDDVDRIEARKAEIADHEWEYCWNMGEQHIAKFGGKARRGGAYWPRYPFNDKRYAHAHDPNWKGLWI